MPQTPHEPSPVPPLPGKNDPVPAELPRVSLKMCPRHLCIRRGRQRRSLELSRVRRSDCAGQLFLS